MYMNNIWRKLSFVEKVKFILSVIAGIFIVIFATLNWIDQDINFIFKTIKVKLSIAIILSVISGYLISFLFYSRKMNSLENENEKLKNKINDLKEDLAENNEDEIPKDVD
ncbi:MAG: LapA family protein [Bacteroidetes bacterium]|nr:LapA family protein [Bacteroidota bacterium]